MARTKHEALAAEMSQLLRDLEQFIGKVQHFLQSVQCTFVAPWAGIETPLSEGIELLIENGRWDTLLYCPYATEMSNEIDWFEKDDYTNSLSYTMRVAFEALERENDGKAIIRRNLDQLALPHFRPLVEKWQNDPDGHDTIPKNPAIVFTKPFAPKNTDDLDAAYAKVRWTSREREFRNYEHLMILWRDRLEELIFTDVNWDDGEKAGFIREWELNLFGWPIKQPARNDGRWEQGMAIDRPTAGKLLQYFIDRFLANPSKHKKDGEIACVLWTMTWFSQDPDVRDITVTRVLDLDTATVDKERPELLFDGKWIEISAGLHRLLTTLRGNGAPKRRRGLFEHISADCLQSALKEASIILFGANTTPVSPTAFLTLPHPMRGSRFSRRQVERLRSADPGSEVSYTRRQILKAFREAQEKSPPSPPNLPSQNEI